MRILIATGIYPPEIGGPAQYAYNMEKEFERQGHTVTVKCFGKIERALPTGFRHLFFLLKSTVAYLRADFVLVLDTFSVAWPISILSRISRRGYVIRTGGDFLWESYVERTKKKVLFKDFYKTEIPFFSRKEKLIFNITKKTLSHATHTVYSTEWQKQIFVETYGLQNHSISVIENFYNVPAATPTTSEPRVWPADAPKPFLISTRDLCWKNKDVLIRCLEKIQADFPAEHVVIDNNTYGNAAFLEKMKNSYAVALMSLGDISPNMILDAIRQGTPFLLTIENGINNRVGQLGMLANPLDEADIYNAIRQMLQPEVYARLKTNLTQFTYTHTWSDIYSEYMDLYIAKFGKHN